MPGFRRFRPPKNADKAIFWGFLALLIWLPLPLGSNRPWAWAVMNMATALLAMSWIIAYLRARVVFSAAIRAAWPVWIILALIACWQMLQALGLPASVSHWLAPKAAEMQQAANATARVSLSTWDTTSSALRATSYALLFALTLMLINSRERLRTLLMVIVLCGVFQAVYGSLMVLSSTEYLLLIPKEAYIGMATGTFVNRNHLAGYLEMALGLGIGLMIADIRSRQSGSWRDTLRRVLGVFLEPKARLRIFLALMVIGLVLCRSRMGNIAFFSSMTLTMLLYVITTRPLTRGVAILFGSLLLVDIFIVGNFFGVERVVERLEATTIESEGRDEMAADTLVMIEDFPWTGIGAGAFHIAYPHYQDIEIRGFVKHAHNDYLQFAAELGIPATLLLLVGVLATVVTAVMATIKRQDPLMRGVAMGSFMGLISIGIHSTVDFNLQIPANAALFVVVLALPWVARHQSRQPG